MLYNIDACSSTLMYAIHSIPYICYVDRQQLSRVKQGCQTGYKTTLSMYIFISVLSLLESFTAVVFLSKDFYFRYYSYYFSSANSIDGIIFEKLRH